MIARRLREKEKIEILEGYRAGMKTNELAKKYTCTSATINRIVKTLLSDDEFSFLKDKRLKNNQSKVESFVEKGIINDKYDKKDNKIKDCFLASKPENNQEVSLSDISNEFDKNEERESEPQIIDNDHELFDETITDNQNENNNFKEVAPLVSSFGFEAKEQKVDCNILDKDILPECVYMIVDKKVELEYQPISDLTEWSFLPEDELKRYAILLYSDQRSAKRNCSRNQRVIKIKNTNVFEISKSHLLLKGITRLIIDDLLISLDN